MKTWLLGCSNWCFLAVECVVKSGLPFFFGGGGSRSTDHDFEDVCRCLVFLNRKLRCVLDVCVVVLDYVTLANVLAEDRGADLTVLRFARHPDLLRTG